MLRKVRRDSKQIGSPDWAMLIKNGFPHVGFIAMLSKYSDMIGQ